MTMFCCLYLVAQTLFSAPKMQGIDHVYMTHLLDIILRGGGQRPRQDCTCVCADLSPMSKNRQSAYRPFVRKAKQDISVNSGPFSLIFAQLCCLKRGLVILHAGFFGSLLILEIMSISQYF